MSSRANANIETKTKTKITRQLLGHVRTRSANVGELSLLVRGNGATRSCNASRGGIEERMVTMHLDPPPRADYRKIPSFC